MSKTMRWTIGIVLLIAITSAAGAQPGLRWWRNHRRAAYISECRSAREDRRWEDMRRIASEWSKVEPLSADPWLFLAEGAEGDRDWQAVADALAQIPESEPKALPALVELAKLQFGVLNQPFRGEESCQKLLRLEPGANFGHHRLIQYYAVTLQREKLVQQIRFAVEQRREPPEAYVYLMLLDTLRIGDGVESNEYWLEGSPDEELFIVARALQFPEPHDVTGIPVEQMEAARKTSATKLALVESLLEKYPANLELLAYVLERAKSRGESDRVGELLSRAPESAARDSRFWGLKGWLHESLEELPEAEAAYREALNIHPLDWNAANGLAGIERRQQDLPEVQRLTKLVDQARTLRIEIRKLKSADSVSPKVLADLSRYARSCGAEWIADALDYRLRKSMQN